MEIFFYSLWDYLFFFYFLLYCAPLVTGAFFLAKKVCSENPFERFAFTMLLTLVTGGVNFGLCGLLKIISVQSIFIANLLMGFLFLFLTKHISGKNNDVEISSSAPAVSSIPLSLRLLTGFLILWAVSRLYPVISMPPFGTDSYMYHLYYPAEWIRSGEINRISIIGLFPEYYPVFGELLYGFLLLPMKENAALASTLQWAALVMASACMVITAEALGYKKQYGLFASCIFFCTGIVMMNLLMAYTDILNGSLCFAGFSFLLLGCRRNSLFLLLFSGLLMGFSTAVKPLGMLWSPVITLTFSLVFLYVYRPSFRNILYMWITAILTALPFFLKNWMDTGNPLYPQELVLCGIKIFSPGIKAGVYAPVGLKNFFPFLFDGGVFGFNKASILLYLIAGTGATLLLLLSLFLPAVAKKAFPDERGKKVFFFFIPFILLFTLLHILIYPRIAEPRSLLLLLFFHCLFFLPLLAATEISIGKWKNIPLAGILAGCILPWSSFTTNFITWFCNWSAGCAGMFFSGFLTNEQRSRKGLYVLLILLALLIPLQFTIRGAGKQHFYKLMFNSDEYRSCKIVQEMFARGEKSIIDYVGGVFAYAYMEDMEGNQVRYIPISEKESTFVHHFGSYGKMREEPVKYEVWLERLQKAGVNILIVNTDTPALIFNRRQELNWAKAHPENFTLLVQDHEEWEKSKFYMYKVHDLSKGE